MNKQVENKLKNLPTTPGVYFHKDKSGEIIYVGKAANLRNRVRQYFQNSRGTDPKTNALIAEIADVEWTEVETELDALFLEAEMVRRYMPRYNILLRDDKSFVYVRIDIKSQHPIVTFTRRPLDDGAEYFGPYLSKFGVNRALKYLRRAFPYSTHTSTNIPKRACLQAQLGLCPGLEAGLTSLEDYRKNLRMLIQYLRGNRKALIRELEKDMKLAAKSSDFEAAAQLRDKLHALKNLDRQIIFGDREAVDISKDRGLVELAELLDLEKPPRRIEGFDISHMSGTDTVASMVVFGSGVPDKSQYRKFKSRVAGNDDFAHMYEVISRRFSERNIKQWGLPDLILIDGGKGQVGAALRALGEKDISIPLIGLAKRYEEIIIPKQTGSLLSQSSSSIKIATQSQFDISVTKTGTENKKTTSNNNQIETSYQFEVVSLSHASDALKLLQRIRDESHRFAVSYHSTLKTKRQTVSGLDEIPGIGPATRKKLIKHFGSLRALNTASEEEISQVVGAAKAKIVLASR